MNNPLGYDASFGPILGHDEPPPVCVYNAHGQSPFLLLGDHAGNALPSSLGNLGVASENLERHIAWDIGVAELGQRLADSLNSVFIHQPYSRLLVDCNRDPASPSSILEISDGTVIPGNRGLEPRQAERRVAEVHTPYHAAIAAELDRRGRARIGSILISLHSFTPSMDGVTRPWEVGVLHDGGDASFAKLVLSALQVGSSLSVGDNAPYHMDSTDYTIPFHAYPRGLPYAELEIRQDLLGHHDAIRGWCSIISRSLLDALGLARKAM
jgi:predicted N-formylglutamate amidohydrolase